MTRLYRFEVPQPLSDETLKAALGELPAWRLSRALSYRRPLDRFLSAQAYILLRRGLREVFSFDEDFSFEYEALGKPRIAGRPDIHFSISHCPRCVCCAVSDAPVGVDVEQIQYDGALARQVFCADELSLIEAASDRPLEFTRLWTMKESYLKMTGEGLRDDLRGVLCGVGASFSADLCPEKGYVLCVCDFL